VAHIKERHTTRTGKVFDVCWRQKEAERWRDRSYTAVTLEEAILVKIAVERGEDPARASPDETTLAAHWSSWESRWRIGKAPKTIRAAQSAREALAPLMSLRLRALSRPTVEDVISDVARRAPRQAQLALAHGKRCLRDAVGRGHDIDPRIFEIPSPAHTERDIRFLSWDEVERLAAYLDPHVHRIVPFAALTGMRRGELFDLQDRQVDLAAGSITLRVTKTRKPRKVWLCANAKQLLREQLLVRPPTSAGYVFTTRNGARLGSRFEKSFRTAVEVAGLEGATFHALRHTCASLMIAARANPLEIAEQLGHSRGGKPDATMIWKRYGWLYDGATKTAVMRLDELVRTSA
jgi:integrase